MFQKAQVDSISRLIMQFFLSKKQAVIAQSSAKVKYIAIVLTANHAQWRRKILSNLSFNQDKDALLKVDNQLTIAITKNPMQHGRTKHIHIKFHALREAVKEWEIQLQYCHTDLQLANILTKGSSRERFEFFRTKLRVYKTETKEVC